MSLPKHRQTTDQREQTDVASHVAAERAERLTPDEEPRHVELTPVQRAAAEREREAMLEALHVPMPKPVPAPMVANTPPEPPPVQPQAPPALSDKHDTVAEALDLQAEALKALEDAKARIEQANLRVVQAREHEAERAHVQGRAEAAKALNPVRARVVALRTELLALHHQYGGPAVGGQARSHGPLAEFARSLASHENLIRRTKLQSLYASAAPLSNAIAVAFKAAEDAIKVCDRALGSGDALYVDVAQKAADTALANDVDALREACARLVSQVNTWRQPGSGVPPREVRITLLPEPPAKVDTEWRQ